MRLEICAVIACVGGLTSRIALAQDAPPPMEEPPTVETPYDPESPSKYSYAWSDPRLYSEIGIGFAIGGGVAGFTSSDMRDATDSSVAGLWNARLTFGTHIPIAFEASYVGTAMDVDTFDGTPNGTLIGTTVEGVLRFNILPHYVVNPYIFAGVGWTRYDLQDAEVSTAVSNMKGRDDLAEFPMGAGLSFRGSRGLMFDLRGTFRAAQDSDLLLDDNGDEVKLHTWEANGSIGYAF